MLMSMSAQRIVTTHINKHFHKQASLQAKEVAIVLQQLLPFMRDVFDLKTAGNALVCHINHMFEMPMPDLGITLVESFKHSAQFSVTAGVQG